MTSSSPRETFHNRLNYVLAAGVGVFLIFFTTALLQWYRMAGGLIETKLFPVFEWVSIDDWQKNEKDQWSGVVTLEKFRPECVYLSGQAQTVLGYLPGDVVRESTITYVGDQTPGSNRATGVQTIDQRVQIDDPSFTPGTKFWGTVVHISHEGSLTVSELGPFLIGQNGPSVGDGIW